ncbi:MAG: hypothetical protein K2N11_09430, partial [Mucispirillum sp.]|nr:hypothetical protein [Mucispirillum sp.]
MVIIKSGLNSALFIKSECSSVYSTVKTDDRNCIDIYEENSKIKSIIIINEILLFILALFNLYKDAIETAYR